MSVISKKVYSFADYVTEALNQVPPKAPSVYVSPASGGIAIRFRSSAKDPKIYEFDITKDFCAQNAPTVVGTVTNPANARDFDDGSYAVINGASEDANYLQWDLGSVKTLYVYWKHGSPNAGAYDRIKYSSDGTTWTQLEALGGSGTLAGFAKITFRYIRWTAWGAVDVYLYSLSVLDPTSYIKLTQGSGSVLIEHEVSTLDAKILMVIDCSSGNLNYYAYKADKVKMTLTEGEVVA